MLAKKKLTITNRVFCAFKIEFVTRTNCQDNLYQVKYQIEQECLLFHIRFVDGVLLL